MQILVVEDTLIAQKVAEMILTGLGCEVTIAGTGEQAIASFRANSYQLIFMDVGLPDMDGLEVTRTIRKLEQQSAQQLEQAKPPVPIVALTANYDAASKALALEAGMDDFFCKPLSKQQAELILNKFVTHTCN